MLLKSNEAGRAEALQSELCSRDLFYCDVLRVRLDNAEVEWTTFVYLSLSFSQSIKYLHALIKRPCASIPTANICSPYEYTKRCDEQHCAGENLAGARHYLNVLCPSGQEGLRKAPSQWDVVGTIRDQVLQPRSV